MRHKGMRSMAQQSILILSVLALMFGFHLGCQRRERHPMPAEQPTRLPDAETAPAQVPLSPVPQPRPLPALNSEPQLTVVVDSGERLWLRLHRRASIGQRQLAAQRLLIERRGENITIAALGIQRPQSLDIHFSEQTRGPTFSIETEAGSTQYAGDIRVLLHQGRLLLCERIGLEDFLPGVIEREMGGTWPFEALKAQAVAARSYIASQYLRHHQRPWHLTAAERVDVAYAGYLAQPQPRLLTALAQTRGDILVYRGLPLTAWFHSCSGGRTAGKNEVFADRLAADGVTDFVAVMPVVEDPWAERGAQGLRRPQVFSWEYTINGAALSWRIREQARKDGRPLDIGTIEGIQIRSHHPSGRVAQLAIRHSGGLWEVDAAQFRLLAGSHAIRSTWWTRLDHQGPEIRIQGRGFGHGVGMSQVSAWAMAQEGMLAAEILRHFYPGAQLVRRW